MTHLRMLGVLLRALTYSTLFVGVVLVYLPFRTLTSAEIASPLGMGLPQMIGTMVTVSGALLAAWCIATFVTAGRGTPAPFDPPRALVIRGPYRFVRNPMYLGAAVALAGAALVYESSALLAYMVGFLLVMHVFVVVYEEPTLRQTFGDDYAEYCRRIHRWRPTLSRRTM